MTDHLLTAPQVAEILALPTDHVYKLVRSDQIPHLRFGRTVRFRRDAILRWLADEERGNGHERR